MLPRNAPRSLAFVCLSLGIVVPVVAQTDESLLLMPWTEGEVVKSSTDVFFMNRSHLDTPDKSTAFFQIESEGRYRLDTSRELNPTLGYDWTHIGLGNNSDPIPGSLDAISVAIGSPLAKVGDWFIGATAGLGYAGPAAFGDGRGWYGKGSLMSGTEFDNGDALVLLIDYDGNRTWFPDLPIPGIAYSAKWGQDAKYVVGLPINALIWKPTDQFEFSLSSYLFISFDVSADYKLTSEWKVFARYADREDAFFDSDLPDNRRLFYTERRVEAGVGYSLDDHLDLEAGVGYAFNRKFSTGFDDRNLDRITDVSSEPYARLGLSVKY